MAAISARSLSVRSDVAVIVIPCFLPIECHLRYPMSSRCGDYLPALGRLLASVRLRWENRVRRIQSCAVPPLTAAHFFACSSWCVVSLRMS